jgi:hypothetical protein
VVGCEGAQRAVLVVGGIVGEVKRVVVDGLMMLRLAWW